MKGFRGLQPWWPVTTVVVTAVAILVPVLIFLAERERPSLALEVRALTALVSPGLEQFDDLTISHIGDGGLSAPIDELWLTSFRLINDGNTTIRKEDFETAIWVRLQDNQAVLGIRIGESNPEYLTPTVAHDPHDDGPIANCCVLILPLLLNPGDSISFSVISTGPMPNPQIESRIARIKEIAKIAAPQGQGEIHISRLMALTIVITLAVAIVWIFLTFVLYRRAGTEKPRT